MDNDYNSPEKVRARMSQEDPYVMYLIVRESLGMSVGKACAQTAHAAQMLQLQFNLVEDDINYWREVGTSSREEEDKFDDDLILSDRFERWLNSSFRKVVLRASDKDWEKLKNKLPQGEFVMVIDAGLTELEPGSETVIGVWPMKKSSAPKVIKRLQVLK